MITGLVYFGLTGLVYFGLLASVHFPSIPLLPSSLSSSSRFYFKSFTQADLEGWASGLLESDLP